MNQTMDLLLVTTGQSIRCHVLPARFVLHLIGIIKQLAHPRVLRNRGQPLIEQMLEAAMIRSDDELLWPLILALMADCLDQPD